ncbi:hypothetical protein niasHT_033826 [Heterodera trifolii]|uniref:Uncharacterized protein n=1 Tax=Heterodera trifolii TaxID=157864 RepID=A0ABD2I832_9BILA
MNALRVFVFLALFCSVVEGGVIRKASDNSKMTEIQMDAMLEWMMPKHRTKVNLQFWELSLKCDELDEELVRKTGADVLKKYNALAEDTKNSLKPYLDFVYGVLEEGHFEEAILCMNSEMKELRGQQKGTTDGGQQQKDTSEMKWNALKKCFISGDGWLCVFDLLPPRQLGLQIALISNRFDFYVDEHFKTRRRALNFIRIWRKIGEDGKKEMQIVNARGQPLPMPAEPMPNKVIGFNGIAINYLDRNVMAFLQHFGRLFTACGTLSIKTNCDRLLEYIIHNIPSSARVHVNSSSSSADDGQPLVIKWLCSSSTGISPPKVLSFRTKEWTEAIIKEANEWTDSKIREIKTAFLGASSPANFCCFFREALFSTCIIMPDPRSEKFTNELTGEQLTVEWRHGDHFRLVRCPISRDDDKKWSQWVDEAIEWHYDNPSHGSRFDGQRIFFGDLRNRIIVTIDVRILDDGFLDDNQAASTEAIPGPSGQQQQTESALN